MWRLAAALSLAWLVTAENSRAAPGQSLTLSPDGNSLFAAHPEAGRVEQLHLLPSSPGGALWRPGASVVVRGGPRAVAPHPLEADRVLVLRDRPAALLEVDLSRSRVKVMHSLRGRPVDLAIRSDQLWVLLECQGSSRIQRHALGSGYPLLGVRHDADRPPRRLRPDPAEPVLYAISPASAPLPGFDALPAALYAARTHPTTGATWTLSREVLSIPMLSGGVPALMLRDRLRTLAGDGTHTMQELSYGGHAAPQDLVFAPASGHAFLAYPDRDLVAVHDAADGAERQDITGLRRPRRMVVDEAREMLYVQGQDEVAAVSLTDLQVQVVHRSAQRNAFDLAQVTRLLAPPSPAAALSGCAECHSGINRDDLPWDLGGPLVLPLDHPPF